MTTEEKLEQAKEAVITTARVRRRAWNTYIATNSGGKHIDWQVAVNKENEALDHLDSLQSPLPSNQVIWKWAEASSCYDNGPRFMAKCLRWRIANPEVDLEAAAVELENRGEQ